MSIENLLNLFRGRAGRARFWTVVAIVLPSFVALVMVFWVYALSIPGAYENGGATPMPKGPFGVLAAIAWFAGLAALAVAMVSVTVRRLHDRGKAWWWIFAFLIVPDALFGYGRYLLDTGMGAMGELPLLFVYAASALYAWGLIELGFLRGTLGENRFGPDPAG
ncbi:MAG TPA: DUF805 domain-containing protein [Rhizomicrobium sp.]|nr:DUF805 domain-containing protein [Rhizomicrobium sp.]